MWKQRTICTYRMEHWQAVPLLKSSRRCFPPVQVGRHLQNVRFMLLGTKTLQTFRLGCVESICVLLHGIGWLEQGQTLDKERFDWRTDPIMEDYLCTRRMTRICSFPSSGSEPVYTGIDMPFDIIVCSSFST